VRVVRHIRATIDLKQLPQSRLGHGRPCRYICVVMGYTEKQRAMDAPGFFWTPPDHVGDGIVTLSALEAKHAILVCRLRKGEMMTVCDGQGNAYDCEITKATPKEVTGKIIRTHRRIGEPVTHVTLAVGIGRPQIYDWIIEKSVELGVARIVPLRCMHSPSGIGGDQAGERRAERWRRLALGAMKQSLRSVLPMVDPITTPEAAIPLIEEHHRAWLADATGIRLAETQPLPARTLKVMLIVGPEGGFSPDERDLFFTHGAQLIRLGSRRLRAETAAIAALTLVMQHLGEL
jgi:16S rRNA (uracil1498-N3)-methyltransferase